jgi:hypothetical protein
MTEAEQLTLRAMNDKDLQYREVFHVTTADTACKKVAEQMIIIGTRSGKPSRPDYVRFESFSEDSGSSGSTSLRTVVRKMKARGRVVVFAFSIKHGTILDSESIADPREISPSAARKLLQRAVAKAFTAGLAARPKRP